MAHLKPEIFQGGFFEVETTQGSEVVPDYLIGRTMSVHVEALLNYLEGTPLEPDELAEHKTGWLARMSAPGYLDATDWSAHASEEAARAHLQALYTED